MNIVRVPISNVVPWDKNPRKIKKDDFARLKKQITELGVYKPLVAYAENGRYVVLGGNMRLRALQELAYGEVDVSVVEVKSEAEKLKFNLSDNDRAGEYDDQALAELVLPQLEAIDLEQYKVDIGEPMDLRMLLGEFAPGGVDPSVVTDRPSLADRFLFPPFSVFDARQGLWIARKRSWLGLGIQSEVGREENLLGFSRHIINKDFYISKREGYVDFPEGGDAVYEKNKGTSVFDPVLCELLYRWFAPLRGRVLDPFAGGSVRGIVASLLGLEYTGLDLNDAQIEEDRKQAEAICPGKFRQAAEEADSLETTPIERRGPYWLKRDDLYRVAGAAGGKARAAWALAQGAKNGLVTAGSRSSPQVNIVAHVARRLNLRCRAHVPSGALTEELELAAATGCEIVQHEPGYNNVIMARAREDAEDLKFRLIPFGMECAEAVELTSAQVRDIPPEVKRIVVPVGSGISLAGILQGLYRNNSSIPVVGVVVGADPEKRLDQFAPPDWRERVILVRPDVEYSTPVEASIEGVTLDPIYEAKCAKFLQPDDLLWIVGLRASERREPVVPPLWIAADARNIDCLDLKHPYDFVFSCPPYYDLEKYTDKPEDLSNAKTYEAFLADYRSIIARSLELLRPNRFACFVVADIRDKDGFYRNFVSDTIRAFEDAGARLYNDAMLVNTCGLLAVRISKQFTTARKLGKVHQNVLIFFKGDPERIREDFPKIVATIPMDEAI